MKGGITDMREKRKNQKLRGITEPAAFSVKVSTASPGYAALSKCPSLLISRSLCTTAAAAIRESGSLHPQTRRNFIVSSATFRPIGKTLHSARNSCKKRSSVTESSDFENTSILVTILTYLLALPKAAANSIGSMMSF